MTTSSLRPVVTFGLLCYNQKEYIEEALLAALAQTYHPLQIIISDDASVDGTAALVGRILAAYQGPHEVLFNVNPVNLGIGAHVNKVFQMAVGELVVLGAGDDISKPDRTKHVVEHWVAGGKSADSIYCGCEQINHAGEILGDFFMAIDASIPTTVQMISYKDRAKLLLLGACSAYTPAVFHRFGPLRDTLSVEDIPLAIRASMLGGISYIAEPLVYYRINVSVWLPRKLKDESFDRHLRRINHRAFANQEVSLQILQDTLRVQDYQATRAAMRRLAATDFSFTCSSIGRFSFIDFFRAAFYSGDWKGTLFPAALHGIPRAHSLIFRLKRSVQDLFARVRNAAG